MQISFCLYLIHLWSFLFFLHQAANWPVNLPCWSHTGSVLNHRWSWWEDFVREAAAWLLPMATDAAQPLTQWPHEDMSLLDRKRVIWAVFRERWRANEPDDGSGPSGGRMKEIRPEARAMEEPMGQTRTTACLPWFKCILWALFFYSVHQVCLLFTTPFTMM